MFHLHRFDPNTWGGKKFDGPANSQEAYDELFGLFVRDLVSRGLTHS